jgi:hypothetical protein
LSKDEPCGPIYSALLSSFYLWRRPRRLRHHPAPADREQRGARQGGGLRNGVAYFERYAALHGTQLKLRVPSERLDDLLKSLTVVDAHSGKAVPVSFPDRRARRRPGRNRDPAAEADAERLEDFVRDREPGLEAELSAEP